ncbi:GvpL/GvpF family gas vesicle protein [Pelotomaculum isophthalicicum JI]|uniref:GvpL/GvpF family gas vesicle protein n=1 Tax=Pelotomaculum isophthalicicum JI TaxID=947010 RepID=A0A9X4H5G8_9FIRM|nr:GvpL/GvpF family gas vesicle protein [Pelotomaculum isophthalicicum]MDF9407604.1 GvpL/GvpF family gas vesicle protein [Pelotomaculum isophthalicicum JI]
MAKKKEGKYLYGIIETRDKRSFGNIGIGGREDIVYTINYRDLAVVASNTPVIIYDPVKENAFAHQRVISDVMEEFDIVPMSFGIISESTEEIINLMKKNYVKFKREIAKIRGKVELGLKIYWKKDSFVKEIQEVNSSISDVKEKLTRENPDAAYYGRIDLGKMVEAAAGEKRNYYHGQIFEPLEKMAVSARKNDIVTPRMVLNASFLVAKEKEPEFDLAVEEIYQQYQDNLDIKYTGPWPPYNFINLKINL